MLAQLETGEIDLPTSSSLTLDFVPQLDELEAAGTITTDYVAGTFWEHLDFGIQRGDDQPSFFDDVRIRQAVAYGINRGQIVDDVQYGRTAVMNTIVPDDHPAYPSGLDEYAYDPDRANELLDEAGVTDSDGDGIREKDGRPLAMTLYTTSNNAVRQAVAEIIQQNLGEVGFDISLEFVPGPDKLFKQGPDGILSPRLFDLAMYAYLSGVQPGVDLYYCDQLPTPENSYSGQNNPGYCNPDYDTAGRAAQAELDIENVARGVPGAADDHQPRPADLPAVPAPQDRRVQGGRHGRGAERDDEPGHLQHRGMGHRYRVMLDALPEIPGSPGTPGQIRG